MFATALAFTAGIFMIPWVIAAFVIFALFAEYKESSGWSVFYALVAGLGFYLIFSPQWQTLLWSIALYVPLGLGWSIFRYRRWANKRVKYFNEEYPQPEMLTGKPLESYKYQLSNLEDRTNPKRNVKKMVYWTILFPISMLESALDDVIAAIEFFITKTLKRVYEKMWKGAMSNANTLPVDPDV